MLGALTVEQPTTKDRNRTETLMDLLIKDLFLPGRGLIDPPKNSLSPCASRRQTMCCVPGAGDVVKITVRRPVCGIRKHSGGDRVSA